MLRAGIKRGFKGLGRDEMQSKYCILDVLTADKGHRNEEVARVNPC